MLDLKIIRENPDLVKENIKKRNLKLNLDDFLALDKLKLELIIQVDEMRETRNKVSKEIPTLSTEEKQGKIIEMKQLGEDLKVVEEKQKQNLEKWNDMYYKIPNVLDATTAIGNTDDDNTVEATYGEKIKFAFPVQAHYEIGEKK